ncbi:MAG TPA: M20/M25/M40 family metallo-hydrolase [Vicinamibacterales bacterium]|nr:M20/M25/M40 family metallo-hydrolase [Vicinamibacterales bacterium]
MTRLIPVLACALAVALAPSLAQVRPGVDPGVLQQIRAEGMDRSQVMSAFDQFVTVIGPRLAGSPEYKRAADWARDTLSAWGLANARLESWEFGRGWALDRLVVEMVEPRYMPLHAYAEAWSASTRGEIVAAPVFIGGKPLADMAAMRDTLNGAIVLSQPLVTTFVRDDRVQPTTSETPVKPGAPPMPRQGTQHQATPQQVAQLLRDAGAGAIIRSSAGEHGTVFVLGRDQGANAVPSIILAAEHYNMVARMVERGVPVKMRVHLQTSFLTSDTKSYNVVAEIPGSDAALKHEVVLLGAHLDSWHTGTGATDNADGSAAVMEAMRILKAIGARPRRTIRVALWGGEEEGLLGSRAYVTAHYSGDVNKAARDSVVAYLNLDPGMGPIYGWYMEASAPAKLLFDRWAEPLKALGVRRNIEAGITNTDHLSFRDVGIPGFNAVQDYLTYDVRTHHTNVDTYERIREEDLKQNAVVLAWYALNIASTDERIPRPEPRPVTPR